MICEGDLCAELAVGEGEEQGEDRRYQQTGWEQKERNPESA